jgi:hypothetical protein
MAGLDDVAQLVEQQLRLRARRVGGFRIDERRMTRGLPQPQQRL